MDRVIQNLMTQKQTKVIYKKLDLNCMDDDFIGDEYTRFCSISEAEFDSHEEKADLKIDSILFSKDPTDVPLAHIEVKLNNGNKFIHG